MLLESKRPYKTAHPAQTVNNIRQKLLKIDCMVYENFWGNPYPDIYSVRIETGESEGKCGTNGKGRNRLYSLASAYAEFMERLQNGILMSSNSLLRIFLNKIKKQTGFYYFPDEKVMTKNDFDNLPKPILEDFLSTNKNLESSDKYFKRLKKNGYSGCISVPFYDVKNDKIIYLPYNILIMLIGSNGMSAGNSADEGIFQALCEIFERYSAFRVFNEKITPPTIKKDFLSIYKDEYEIIQNIEADNKYKVIVKDFSTNEKYPVLGVMIIDQNKNKYRLNIGSDTSFKVALNRCLTEIFQGSKSKEQMEKWMNPIQEKEYEFFIKTDTDNNQKRLNEYKYFTINGSGKFPKSLFSSKADYKFQKDIFQSSNNYKSEVNKLVKNVLDLGHNVYIRDVSYLGFPSFLVYIPKLSPIGKKDNFKQGNIIINETIKVDIIEDIFFPFDENDTDQLLKIAKILDNDEYNSIEMKNILRLDFKYDSVWDKVPTAFFLILIWYKLDNIEAALKNLKIFIKESKNENDEYYNTVQRLFELQIENKKPFLEYLQLLINEGYDKIIVEDVINSFSDKKNLFNFVDIPQCPECKICKLSNECLTKNTLTFINRINREMHTNKINQNELKKLFK